MTKRKIAIVGAGVAGMSVAILAKMKGFEVCVYERRKSVSSLGAGVTLWPNAVYVLKKLGIYDPLKPLCGTPSVISQCNGVGVEFNRVSIEEVSQLSGFATMTVLRRDLMQVLYNKLESLSIPLVFGQDITSTKLEQLQQSNDLVIGADGRMNSVVREAIYPNQQLSRFHGFINVIGISPSDERFPDAITEFRDNKQRFGLVPVAKNLSYWAAAWPCTKDLQRQQEDWFEEMETRFEHWHPVISTVISNAIGNSKKAILVHDIDPLPYWHKNKLILIGDAAHAPLPTSGQGACQALEDAWHLVLTLSKHTSVEQACREFYKIRIDKTSVAQKSGRSLAYALFHQQHSAQNSGSKTSVELPSPKSLSQLWMSGLS